MEYEELEHVISLSLKADQKTINEVGNQLLEFIQEPESIPSFVQLIQKSNNHTFITASYIYLEKAVILQWEKFSQEDKNKIESVVLDLYFQKPDYQKQIVGLIQFFLKQSESLEIFLPYLTKEITQNNISDIITLYSITISFLPQNYLEDQKDYILFLVSKSFEIIKNNIDAEISTFHVSIIIAEKFKKYDIIQDQIEPISQILFRDNISDSQFTVIIELFKHLLPKLIEFTEVQQFYSTIALNLAEEKSLSLFRRSIALGSLRYQIKSGLIESKDIFHLIDLSFELLVGYAAENTELDHCDLINILSVSVENIIPEDELFEYITAIEEKALNSENVDIITAGIYIISILMNYCPNSFLANQENEIKKLEFLLNDTYPEKIQLAVLIALQQVSSAFQLFPIVFQQKLIPFIFCSTNDDISFNACSALFDLTKIESFNNQEFFQIMWENRDEFVKSQPDFFMEILFQCSLGLNELDQGILDELVNLVLFYLNPEGESNYLSAALMLSVSILSFSEEKNTEILNRIYQIIEISLQSEDDNLLRIIMKFLYIFISQLKYDSLKLLDDYKDDIIKEILKEINLENNSQSLSVGAAIVKYWNCQQIKQIIYRRVITHIKFEVEFDDIQIEQDEIDQSMIKGEFSYFRILSFLIGHLEPDEALHVFKLSLEWSKYHFDSVLKILKKLIKHAHPENYNNFISTFFTLVNESLTSNDYRNLQLSYELSAGFFSMETEHLNQSISEFIENLKNEMNNPQLTEIHKDNFIGIFSDAVLYKKISEEQIQDLFLFVFSIVFQQPPQLMWQNISYFINISLSNYPNFINLKEFKDSFENFIQILLNWLQEPAESELSMTETNDNIASLLLTIISITKLDSKEILEIALNLFPPQDETETESMAKRIIEIYQENKESLSVHSLSLIAAALIRFLTMNIKKKKKINIDEEMVKSIMTLLKNLMNNPEIASSVHSLFEESPEKIEFINNL